MDRRLTALYGLTACLASIAPLGAGFAMKLLIDTLLGQRFFGYGLTIVSVLGAHQLTVASSAVVRFALHEQYFDYLFRYSLQNELSLRFHEKLTQLDVEHLENPAAQTLINKVRDTYNWRLPDIMRASSTLFGDVAAFAVATLALAPFGLWIPLLMCCAALPRMVIRARMGGLQWSIYGSGAPRARRLWYFATLFSDEKALREIKIFGAAPALLARYRDIQKELFEASRAPLARNRALMIAGPLLESAAAFLVAYDVLPRVVSGQTSIGTYAFFLSMLQLLTTSVAGIGTNGGFVYENSLFAKMFFELMALPRTIVEAPDPVVLAPSRVPRIEFRHVSFSYPQGPLVLRDVSFVIEPGRSVALVGANGAGKSTIIKLLCRFYDATEGQILVDGVDIRTISLASWYQHLGTLFQDFVRYKLSVRENIVFGRASQPIDEGRVRAAASGASAAGFIERLDNGYHQILGNEFDEGVDLSGGQWQKLAIARALYRQPSILVMDEPTSAIDAEAELEIFNALEAQCRGRTLILVSHRFSTVRSAQTILVMDQGRLIERGTHDSLLRQNGRYASMFTAQAHGYS